MKTFPQPATDTSWSTRRFARIQITNLKRLTDASAFDDDVVEATAVGERSDLEQNNQPDRTILAQMTTCTSFKRSSLSVQQMQPFWSSIMLSFTPTARVPTVFTSAASMLTWSE
jgi:hypothetical protein